MANKKIEKKKVDKQKIFTKIMAGFLAALMVLGAVAMLIYYL